VYHKMIQLYHSISQNGTNILEIAKDHQIGRVPENGTNVPFNFTEGWSG
jgi:hypothetical protein